jgi:hypothetical protein
MPINQLSHFESAEDFRTTHPPSQRGPQKRSQPNESAAVTFDHQVIRPNLYRALRELQAALRHRLLADPDFSQLQSQTFQFCVPLLSFLCIFCIGIIVPRHPVMKARVTEVLEDTRRSKTELLEVALVLCGWVMAGLFTLRSAVWALARTGRLLCELDLSKLDGSEEREGREYELSQKNLIVGGLLI